MVKTLPPYTNVSLMEGMNSLEKLHKLHSKLEYSTNVTNEYLTEHRHTLELFIIDPNDRRLHSFRIQGKHSRLGPELNADIFTRRVSIELDKVT
jgi:hypothetical protein